MSAELIVLESAGLNATVSTCGAELHGLADREGNDLQWNGDPAVWRGRAPILFPVIGLLHDGAYRLDGKRYPMPKHGFARDSMFSVVARDTSRATLRLSASPETRALYPFAFRLDVGFALTDATLTLTATIANLGEQPMPASFGFHPALRWPLPYGQPRADHRLRFARPEPAPVRRIDKNGFLLAAPVPTPVAGDTLELRDDLFVDDALIFDRLASRSVTYGAGRGPRLEIGFDDFPTLGVWTKPGAGFLCVEPWHGFSDPVGFAGDLRDKPGIFEVAPHGETTMAMTITLIAETGT